MQQHAQSRAATGSLPLWTCATVRSGSSFRQRESRSASPISGRQTSIQVATQVGAITALRTEKDVGSTSPLHQAHAIVGGAVSRSIATHYKRITVGIATTTARENHLLYQIDILDIEAGQIGALLAISPYIYITSSR